MNKKSFKGIACLAAVLALAPPATAQVQVRSPEQTGSPAQAHPMVDAEAVRRAIEAANLLPTTRGDGPYPAVIGTDPTLPNHVIYRPADLTPFRGKKLPLLVWANGGCGADGSAHRQHLAEIASYGYLVIAAGAWRSGPGATAPRVPAGGNVPAPNTTTADVRAGLDWALAETGRRGSAYHGLVDKSAIAVAGHSCGGLQAIQIAADPRVKTVLIHDSGIYNDGRPAPFGMNFGKEALNALHTSVIYILGGPEDRAYPNGSDDVERLARRHLPVVLASLPVGHGGTFLSPMGGAAAHVAVDWLEWQLRGDKVAARTFVGENCRLCSGTYWTLKTANVGPARKAQFTQGE